MARKTKDTEIFSELQANPRVWHFPNELRMEGGRTIEGRRMFDEYENPRGVFRQACDDFPQDTDDGQECRGLQEHSRQMVVPA